jgi:hypothetical protein
MRKNLNFNELGRQNFLFLAGMNYGSEKKSFFWCVQAWWVQILEDFGAEKRHGRLQGGDEDGGLLGGMS